MTGPGQAVAPSAQLEALLDGYGFTVDDIVDATGCSASAIYARRALDTRARRSATDREIDKLYFVVTSLEDSGMARSDVRWWLTARSHYFDGATPASVLRHEQEPGVAFVCAAGAAFLQGMRPSDFAARHKRSPAPVLALAGGGGRRRRSGR